MLLRYRRDPQLAQRSWHLLEMRSPEQLEVIARRIITSVPAIFGSNAVELFVFQQIAALGWIFVRCIDDQLVLKLRNIRGAGFENSKVVEDDYVQSLISKAKAEYEQRWSAIREGSFVRIIDGFTRDYCGTVETLRNKTATVRVDACATRIVVRTPIGNLEDLSHIHRSGRVFYCAAKGGNS